MMKPSHCVFPILWAVAFVVGMSTLQTGTFGEIAASHPIVESAGVHISKG